ncbi:hypothetical protein BOVATA_015030 [Babesia ovata]|uniref:Uncharacterized protein n=1 Tax=Babesia ovata TaxID=189622 RepID=A0A2H6KAJ7_9APIC|nr:uncharacterized protein BOVATA_015030 [Babesia ovata]GBE60010.1 hypothetical protein BOVATA_015030 [Babesia ovata]
MSLVETIHVGLDVTKLNCTTVTNLPCRLCNRRFGRSPDLLFGGIVEIGNCLGKLVDCFLKLLFDLSEFGMKLLNLCLHSADRSVHGLGGASGLARRDAGSGTRIVKLTVKVPSNL